MKIIIAVCSLTILICFCYWVFGHQVNAMWYITPSIIIVICVSARYSGNNDGEPNFHNKNQIDYFKGRKTKHDWDEWYKNN